MTVFLDLIQVTTVHRDQAITVQNNYLFHCCEWIKKSGRFRAWSALEEFVLQTESSNSKAGKKRIVDWNFRLTA
ncbi:hypothetical protein CDAR_574941 [Caerostris darwini]|uniref:Uncharacterized protein n=1 Tax=Caerostris darwini TaxID=1538125 RepID=A0AAV4SX55_9ARAC|nr:hypothetical protein CDAR_574941 [Caerostris darwini]